MLVDYHVHTAYSDDSLYPMEQVVRDAMALGLQEICFTDHVDYGVKRDWDDPRGIEYCAGGPGEPERLPLANIDHPRYAAEIAALAEKYAGKIQLRMGAEFGMQTHTVAQYEALFARYPYDFVILSVHQIQNRELWNQAYQRDRTQEAYQMGYYEQLLALVQSYQNYSVLGHLDLIARYDLAGDFPFERRKPILTEILRRVIADGKGIEVNTSCYRYGLSNLTPSREILMLYRELGGQLLTIGSDSHKKEHLGKHIPQALRELKAMGFDTVCTYQSMEPIFHPI